MKHNVQFTIPVNDESFHEIKDKIPRKFYEEIETRRELAIMRDVMSSKGNNILEKVDNTLKSWNEEKTTSKRYKLKYKY